MTKPTTGRNTDWVRVDYTLDGQWVSRFVFLIDDRIQFSGIKQRLDVTARPDDTLLLPIDEAERIADLIEGNPEFATNQQLILALRKQIESSRRLGYV